MIDRDRPIADHDTDERDNTRSDRVHRGSQLRRNVDPEVALPSPKPFEGDEHRCPRRRSEVCATSGRQQRGNEKEGERDRHRFDTAATRVNVSRGCTRGNRCPLWLALEASLSPPPAAGESECRSLDGDGLLVAEDVVDDATEVCGAKGLRQVLVDPRIICLLDIRGVRSSGQHHNGKPVQRGFVLHELEHVPSAHVREAEVEEEEVWRRRERTVARFLACRNGDDLDVEGSQGYFNEAAQDATVVNSQNSVHPRS